MSLKTFGGTLIELERKMHEKCAVVGAVTENTEIDAAEITFYALDKLQHRGDAGSGITALTYKNRLQHVSGPGFVKDVFDEDTLSNMAGPMAIGHNRYPTSGGSKGHFQPIYHKKLGLSLGHNGTLTETDELNKDLKSRSRWSLKRRSLNGLNDSEEMSLAIANRIKQGMTLPEAVTETYPELTGAFSCVASHDGAVVAFRDQFGLRPLSLGAIEGGHMVASETCGFYPARAKNLGEVKPGEMVILEKGKVERHQLAEPNPKLDIFEIVYFSSPDSEMYGESIAQMRYRMGQELAEQYPLEGDNYLVVHAPDSAISLAAGYSNSLDLEFRPDFIQKHRFRGGRSFQQPSQKARQNYLEKKFSYAAGIAEDRDLLIVDDSIVRLNTAQKLYELGMRAGARSVSFLVGSPPIGYPDFSGIDTPDQTKLIAFENNPAQIREQIGEKCIFLGYLGLSRMIWATGQPAEAFNLASFNGEYPYNIGKNVVKPAVSLDHLEGAYSAAT